QSGIAVTIDPASVALVDFQRANEATYLLDRAAAASGQGPFVKGSVGANERIELVIRDIASVVIDRNAVDAAKKTVTGSPVAAFRRLFITHAVLVRVHKSTLVEIKADASGGTVSISGEVSGRYARTKTNTEFFISVSGVYLD